MIPRDPTRRLTRRLKMAKKARQRGKVHASSSGDDFTSPRDGYGLPRRITARATENPDLPGIIVTVEIEAEEGRARARSVLVETEGTAGVGWTVLANVPTRDIVATAVLASLWRMLPGDDEGTTRHLPLSLSVADVDIDEVREIVQSAVGYRPNMDRFEGVRA
jgi:hypothetical protein